MNPKRIKTLRQLHDAAMRKRAVVLQPLNWRRLPAAFVINFNGSMLFRLLENPNGLWLYEKPKKKIKPPTKKP